MTRNGLVPVNERTHVVEGSNPSVFDTWPRINA